MIFKCFGLNKHIISQKTINFFLNKVLVLSVIWDEIDMIQAFEEHYFKYEGSPGDWTEKYGYRLLFKGPQFKKSIRLWCSAFHIKKEELILTYMKAFCKKLNKEFTYNEKIKTFSREETRTIQKKYERFRDYYRFKKKIEEIEEGITFEKK